MSSKNNVTGLEEKSCHIKAKTSYILTKRQKGRISQQIV